MRENSILIPPIPMQPSDNDFPFTLKRRQFPVRPSFCMTVNKSQGQSFKRAGVYLPKPLLTHGQLYVAASRIGDPKAIRFVINQAAYKPLIAKAERKRPKSAIQLGNVSIQLISYIPTEIDRRTTKNRDATNATNTYN